MPLDAKPEKRIVVDDNQVGRVVNAYTPHFATCEFADQHRKKPTPAALVVAKEIKKP